MTLVRLQSLLFLLCCVYLVVVVHANDFVDEWGELAYKRCLKLMKKTHPLAICTEFRDAVEQALTMQSETMAMATAVAATDIMRESRKNSFYRKVGVEIVDDVLEWVLDKRIRDTERVERRLSSQFGSWLLKIAAKDTNMQNVGKLPVHHTVAF